MSYKAEDNWNKQNIDYFLFLKSYCTSITAPTQLKISSKPKNTRKQNTQKIIICSN